MIDRASNDPTRQPRSTPPLIIIAVAFLLLFSGFIGLGTWQLYRLSWKLELIERVETRIHSAAVPAPDTVEWSHISTARDEYRHVSLTGHFLDDKDTRVQAVTALGAGFWVMSPFQLRDGNIVLVNRGFIPSEWHAPIPKSTAERVVGLLRVTEPRGGFLRENDPIANRWYSRDVAAIASARHLDNVAPYFVDAEPAATDTEWPRAGLTVTHFNNNHLGYALTWFALALMVLWGAWRVWREERRLHRLRKKSGGD